MRSSWKRLRPNNVALQEELQNELADETNKNKDDILHCEMLEKHYEERGELYEVRILSKPQTAYGD